MIAFANTYFDDILNLSLKGSFFSESANCLSNLQKKIQITILNLEFEFPALNSEQLIQTSSADLKCFYGDLKNALHFLKKSYL